MRHFRRLPPLLRVVGVLGLLFPLTSLVIFSVSLASFTMSHLSSSPELANDPRTLVIAMNLTMLGGACTFAVTSYNMRFRRMDGGPFPFDSWQSQARAIALLAALPLCAITLAAVIPPTLTIFVLVFPASMLGALALVAAYLWLILRPGGALM